MRSVVAVPAAARPEPIEHSCHATHASLPDVALNVPCAQLAHVRSDDTVGAAVSRSDTEHACTAWHDEPSLLVEKVYPAAHAAHVRSVALVPSFARPSPTAQSRHAVHDPAPSAAYVPAAHGVAVALPSHE